MLSLSRSTSGETLLIKIPKCDAERKAAQSKKIAEPLERKEIYFMLKALQFKKWLT